MNRAPLSDYVGINRPQGRATGNVPAVSRFDQENEKYQVKEQKKPGSESVEPIKSAVMAEKKKCRDCGENLMSNWICCPVCRLPINLDFMALPLDQFFDRVADKTPVPGAGTVAAVVGILATALLQTVAMVGQGSKHVQEENKSTLREMHDRCNEIRIELSCLAERDSKQFKDFYDSTKSGQPLSPEVTVKFQRIMDNPLQAAGLCLELGQLAQEITGLGSPFTSGDMAAAFFCARAALLSLTQILQCNMNRMLDRCGEYRPNQSYLDTTTAEATNLVAKFPTNFKCPV
jgi:formiminotetrahydrofolate cyclodeaminase